MPKHEKKAKSTEDVADSSSPILQPEKPGEQPTTKSSLPIYPHMHDRTSENGGGGFLIIGGVASAPKKPTEEKDK
jgi:hypothetical protein